MVAKPHSTLEAMLEASFCAHDKIDEKERRRRREGADREHKCYLNTHASTCRTSPYFIASLP